MAEGTVDNLNIQLSADADQAVKSLNNLASTLRSINTAFTKDISGMRKFSKEIGTMGASLRSLGKIKVDLPNMKGLESVFKILKDVDGDSATKASDSLKKVADSMSALGKVNFNDSGVTKLTNSLIRLTKVDLSNFNTDSFKKITDSIATLGNMPDVSSGVNRFVSSLSRLANAGEKTGQSASSILKLGEQTKLAAKQLQSVGAINDDVNLFVQSIGRLASAGSKTGQTASGLSTLAKETIEFFKAMQNAPRVSENTIRMTQALAQLASAGGRVNTATNTVSNAFSKLASVGNKTLSAMKKVSSGIVSAFKNIGNSSGNLTKAQFSLSNLLKTTVGFSLGYALVDFTKQTFTLGSSMTEVANVIDVSFGSMNQQAYDFAKTAQEQFGLSELAALKYSGVLMSMFNASGVAQKDAAEMSTTLTGLAGDLASFYNINQDDAFTKLRSALSGEVEPMRQLGVDMTVASLEAYALAQGITESYQSMSQAEKVMLRYNYIMDVTKAQQRDFSDTAHTFANQLRLLTLNVQQLAATLGQGLTQAVRPALVALNKLFAVLQKAAVAVRNFFYVLMGYQGEPDRGIVSDIATAMDDIADSSGAATGGISDAADAAEDLKDQLTLLPFDEINKLSDVSVGDNGSGGSGGGAGGLGGGDLGLDDGLLGLGDKDPEKYVSPWAERIRKAFLAEDWQQLGWEIADGLNAGLRKVYEVISWENVGPKITAFTSAFTTTFNSFAQSFDFDLLGRTIGAGINTVVNTLNQLIDGIDWIALGERFAHGFNGLVDEVDWLKLGRLIGNKFMIAWDTLLGFVTTLKWDEIGRSLADGFNGMLVETDLGDIGTTIGTIVAGIIEMFREFFANADWGEVAYQIKEGISNALKAASDSGKNDGILAAVIGIGAISGLANVIFPVAKAIDGLSKSLGGSGLAKSAGDVLKSMTGKTGISGVFTGIKTALSGISAPAVVATGAIAIISGGIVDLWNTSKTFRDSVSEMWDRIADAFVYAKERIWDEGLAPLGDDISGFFSSIYDFYESSGIKSAFEEIATFIGDVLSTNISVAIEIIGNAFGTVISVVGDLLEILSGAIDFVTGIFTGDWEKAWNGVQDIVDGIVNAIEDLFFGLWDAITIIFEPIVNFFEDKFTRAKDAVQNAWKNISNWFSERWTGIKNVFSPVAETFRGWFKNAYTNVQNIWKNVSGWFQERWTGIKNVFSDVVSFFQSGFESAYGAVTRVWNGIGEFFRGIANSAIEPIGKLVNGIIDGINWVGDKLGVGKVLNNWDVPQFASGSNGIQRDTFGVVNDQKGATYKELILPPNGKPFIPKGRNVMLPLQKGTKIMPAGQTEELMKLMKIPGFSGGIGDFFGGAWSAIKSFAGDVWNYLTHPGDLVKVALDKFIKLGDFFEPWLTIASGAVNKLFSGITDFISGLFDKAIPEVSYNPSAGVEQWRSLAKYALQLTGQYTESNLNRLLMQMQTESGGNPNAINNWDINAKNGTPSKGLMQVIDPTFQAYKYPGYNNIWDPLSNILAAIRYTVSRYGSLARGWQGHGYASGIGTITWGDLFNSIPKLSTGGLIQAPTLALTGERFRKEAVLPLENRKTMGLIANSIIDNADGSIGLSKEELRDAVSQGVAMAMMNSKNGQNITVYAELKTENDEVLARAVTRGQQKLDYRFKPVSQIG